MTGGVYFFMQKVLSIRGIQLVMIMVVAIGIAAVSILIVSEVYLPNTANIPYVPSNIAHSLGSVTDVVQGEASWTTTDIKKVKDEVDYTVMGTVVHVSEPIPWRDPTPKSSGYVETRGSSVKIQVDIEVDEIGKGERLLDRGSVVTVVITGKLLNDVLYLDGGEEHYELGERVIVHVVKDPHNIMGNDVLYVKLGEFGKYKIQNNLAYNEQFPEGRSISSVMSEAR